MTDRLGPPIRPSDQLVVRDAGGAEHRVRAVSSVEGEMVGRRRVHTFVGVYVRGPGWTDRIFWPLTDVRRPRLAATEHVTD